MADASIKLAEEILSKVDIKVLVLLSARLNLALKIVKSAYLGKNGHHFAP